MTSASIDLTRGNKTFLIFKIAMLLYNISKFFKRKLLRRILYLSLFIQQNETEDFYTTRNLLMVIKDKSHDPLLLKKIKWFENCFVTNLRNSIQFVLFMSTINLVNIFEKKCDSFWARIFSSKKFGLTSRF